jgi:hypothetical protein
MADKLAKVVGKHIKGCGAVEQVRLGHWDTCWGPIAYGERGEPVVKTWRKYGKNGQALRTWVRFVCNHVGCKAELHVEADFILSAVKKSYRL